MTMSRDWYIYIVECSDGTYYTGVTNDLDNRIATHNKGKGAKYTRGRLPVHLRWYGTGLSRSIAQRLESIVRKLPRSVKFKLIEGTTCVSEILSNRKEGIWHVFR